MEKVKEMRVFQLSENFLAHVVATDHIVNNSIISNNFRNRDNK